MMFTYVCVLADEGDSVVSYPAADVHDCADDAQRHLPTTRSDRGQL